MISQAILVTLFMLLANEINSAPIFTRVGCPHPTSCGNLTIPFPFGTSSDCSLDDSFLITCNSSYNPPKPFLNSGTTEVLNISLDGLMKVASSVASDCYDKSGAQINGTISELTMSKFPISGTRNKFTAVGCDTFALVEGFEEWKQMSAGCVSWCDSIDSVVNGTCSGIGCCQTSIPRGIKDFLVDIRSFRNHTRVKSFNPCGYAFVVEDEAFEFSSSDLKDLQNRKTVPVVLDWSVGNLTCKEAQKDNSSYACRAAHSECRDSSNGIGYLCNCLPGFEGNPYLLDGCRDIDECTTLKPCEGTCTNLPGSYFCSCEKGFEGDGKKDGTGCHRKSQTNGSTLFYIASGFMVPAVGSSWIFWRRKQKKVVKLRKQIFWRHGGHLLEHMPSSKRTLKIFTAEDLKKATDNYNENNILGRDQHSGTSYKGMLTNCGVNQMVTINMFEALGRCCIEEFIRKLVILSQINHTNMVKLLGCCLETEVPLLVYEFFTVRTLRYYIHVDDPAYYLSWDIRLRIATETARALAHMHDAAPVPLVHGNLNSSSILLHQGCTVKLHDFALTCSNFPHMQFYTSDYVDPAYSLTGRLTVKSDVYNFGVVLAELLVGRKINRLVTQEEEYLFQSFSLLRKLDHGLVTDGKIEQITEVAKLAERCSSLSSMERPTMKEVVIALECVGSTNSGSTAISPNSSQETTARRVVRRNRSF